MVCWFFWKARQLLASTREAAAGAVGREQFHLIPACWIIIVSLRQPVHEDMMVDEPWDALKGEVGPVLASIDPLARTERGSGPDV